MIAFYNQIMRYQLYREQQLNCDIDTAWDFFSSPHNLSKLTPKEMGFTVRSKDLNPEISEEMIIEYKITPILGIPLKWITRITQVEKYKSFTDFQVKGPYRYWNHFHEFIPNENGVLMKDTIDYEMPFGLLGTIVHRLFVKKKLENIFQHRFETLDKRFNATNEL